jgi:hypothetical protein
MSSCPVLRRNNNMPQKLLDVLMLRSCSHEFSWPRRSADGHYYQVCLLCAVEYKYDWKTMRRVERVDHAAPDSSTTRPARSHTRKPTWVPRARRLKLDLAARYRVKNLGSWHEGIVQNLSQSGVLLEGPQQFPDNALIEMVFEMPEEISGQKNSNVLCQGRVIRSRAAQSSPDKTEMAASILDYKFLHSS